MSFKQTVEEEIRQGFPTLTDPHALRLLYLTFAMGFMHAMRPSYNKDPDVRVVVEVMTFILALTNEPPSPPRGTDPSKN